MDRYEKLRSLAIKAQNLAREIALAKGDFEAAEFDLVEQAEDMCDNAYSSLKLACGGKW
jgi:hypothetical protein